MPLESAGAWRPSGGGVTVGGGTYQSGGRGGEFGASGQGQQAQWSQMARDQEKEDRIAAQQLSNRLQQQQEARQKAGTTYQPWQTSREDKFLSAFGGYEGYDTPSGRLWDPFKGLSFDEWNTMVDYGEFDTGPIMNYSRPSWGGGGGGGGWDYTGYGGGGGGGGGYGGYPRYRQNPQEMIGTYNPQSPLLQRAIDIHGGMAGGSTPQFGFVAGMARGGIVSLLRLN